MEPWQIDPAQWGKKVYRKIPISRYVRLARERHINDLKRSYEDPSFPYYYDNTAADKAVWFISLHRHVEGQWFGQPFVLADWQEYDIIRPLFGWKRKSDGKRRFRIAYVELPRKNAKSTLAAAIGNYLTISDMEYGAQVFAAATKEDQAKIVWGLAKKMLSHSPDLSGFVQPFSKSLYCPALGSLFKPLGRDSKSLDGLNVHGALIDEYHAHKTTEMYDVLAEGRGAREQPLIFIITTAGFLTEGPCRVESLFAKKLLDGVIENDQYFAFVSTVDDPEAWTEEEEHIKANPNWGISVIPERFREDFQLANKSIIKQNSFKNKRLNIWTGQATRWLSLEDWDKCGQLWKPEDFYGKPCWGGLDLGVSHDLSAFSLAFRGQEIALANGEKVNFIHFLNTYWIPEEGMLERWRTDSVPYPAWVDEGWINVTPGKTTAYGTVRADINKLADLFDIREIAVDRAHAHQLMVELEDDGLTIVKHAQNMAAMTFPCRSFEEIVKSGLIRHRNDPVFRWQVSNVAVVTDGNENLKIMKNKSGDRVDGVVAACMAVGRLLICPDPEFVYNERGIFVGGKRA